MKIKRYFGKSIREAIQKVREEQGPDAVILSNRKVEGGVEIVAAIDFDEVLLDADASTARGQRREPFIPTPQTRAATPPRPRPAAPIPQPAAGAEPALTEMRRELKNLRGLLERELTSLVWGDVARRNPMQANLLRLLLRLEISPGLCQQIVGELVEAQDARSAWRNALGLLAHKLPVTDDDILTQGGVVALLGPTGVGKTTTVAKLAARFAVRHGARQVALVTTDNFRIGAHEQLRAYAKLLNVPLRIAADHAELHETLKDLSEKRLVLIDTAGMSQRDLRLAEQFELLQGGASAVKCYMVLSATTREAALDEVIRSYRRIRPAGCILTKVDEVGSLGAAMSLVIKHGLPIAYVSDGQRVPEDLYTARAHSLISRSVTMMRHAPQTPEAAAQALALWGTAAHAC